MQGGCSSGVQAERYGSATWGCRNLAWGVEDVVSVSTPWAAAGGGQSSLGLEEEARRRRGLWSVGRPLPGPREAPAPACLLGPLPKAHHSWLPESCSLCGAPVRPCCRPPLSPLGPESGTPTPHPPLPSVPGSSTETATWDQCLLMSANVC